MERPAKFIKEHGEWKAREFHKIVYGDKLD